MRRWTETSSPGAPSRSSGSLFDRLPEFYREEPGCLRSLLEVADELVDATREALSKVEEGLQSSPSERARSPRGSLGEVLENLPSGWPPPRAVWQDAMLCQLEGDTLLPRSGRVASVALLWEEADLEGCSREVALRAEDLPVGARLQLVVVRRLPARLPIEGTRLHGVVVWQKEA